MDDEFALCWNNFQDNIAAGFQNLLDRGDLVDVTLACDGKLLYAHKIVLAICSPYFQEMFITNSCKHPIVVLKDVGYSVMSELLQFMYQGVVNVKHTELSTFMKIAQTLQIKGLATSSSQKSPSHSQTGGSGSQSKSGGGSGNGSYGHHNLNAGNTSGYNAENSSSGGNVIETKINSSIYSLNKGLATETQSAGSAGAASTSSSAISLTKRPSEYGQSDPLSMYNKRSYKRSSEHGDTDAMNSGDSMDHMSSDETCMLPIPQISMIESKYDLNSVKRELSIELPSSPSSLRGSLPPPFNFEYMYPKPPSIEYPNELHMGNDYSKGAGNHMDVPPAGGNITMLSSTSLLHGNCIFNRNNTVATQQGMKTYWLCKSYRISMCRARCITHQGRVISATGVHNHPPHMKGHTNNELHCPPMGLNNNCAMNSGSPSTNPMRMPPSSQSSMPHNMHLPPQQMSNVPSNHQLHHTSGGMQQQTNNATAIQNMMQNVLSQNNLMHLSNISPMLNTLPQNALLNNIQPPSGLQITPILNDTQTSRNDDNDLEHSPVIENTSKDSSSRNSNSKMGGSLDNVHNNVTISNTNSSSVVSVTSSPIEECPSVSQDSNNSNQSAIMSISISPTQPTFKMETM